MSLGSTGFSQSMSDDVDAAMARAMLAVMSSPYSSSHSPRQSGCRGGAFQPYEPPFPAPEAEVVAGVSEGQVMMKKAFAILRRIRPTTSPDSRPVAAGSQLNHVMSERKRREKLNESFAALRASLPPGTKNDKASVLSSTINYVKRLHKEISEMEQKNRLMEARRLPPEEAQAGNAAAPGDRVTVEIVKPAAADSSPGGFQKAVELRVAVSPAEDCDMIDVVLRILECLKNAGGVSLAALDANIRCTPANIPVRQAILTLQIKGSGWDENSIRVAVAGAVDEAAASARPEGSPPP